MFVTGGADNQTGWSNAKYDELIARRREGSATQQKRLRMFHDAEQILMDELPVIPVYVLVTRNMVRPYVHGFYRKRAGHASAWREYGSMSSRAIATCTAEGLR